MYTLQSNSIQAIPEKNIVRVERHLNYHCMGGGRSLSSNCVVMYVNEYVILWVTAIKKSAFHLYIGYLQIPELDMFPFKNHKNNEEIQN